MNTHNNLLTWQVNNFLLLHWRSSCFAGNSHCSAASQRHTVAAPPGTAATQPQQNSTKKSSKLHCTTVFPCPTNSPVNLFLCRSPLQFPAAKEIRYLRRLLFRYHGGVRQRRHCGDECEAGVSVVVLRILGTLTAAQPPPTHTIETLTTAHPSLIHRSSPPLTRRSSPPLIPVVPPPHARDSIPTAAPPRSAPSRDSAPTIAPAHRDSAPLQLNPHRRSASLNPKPRLSPHCRSTPPRLNPHLRSTPPRLSPTANPSITVNPNTAAPPRSAPHRPAIRSANPPELGSTIVK